LRKSVSSILDEKMDYEMEGVEGTSEEQDQII
jgi:hypothetical protein